MDVSSSSGVNNNNKNDLPTAAPNGAPGSSGFPLRPTKMAATFRSLIEKLTPTTDPTRQNGFSKAPEGALFPKTNPVIDGEDCLHDCASCTIKYPSKFSIDQDAKLYGHVDEWSTHLVVATGKTDWVREVANEKGSVMEAVDKLKGSITTGV